MPSQGGSAALLCSVDTRPMIAADWNRATAKGALRNRVGTLVVELARHNIRMNSMLAGNISASLSRNRHGPASHWQASGAQILLGRNDESVGGLRGVTHPLGEIATSTTAIEILAVRRHGST